MAKECRIKVAKGISSKFFEVLSNFNIILDSLSNFLNLQLIKNLLWNTYFVSHLNCTFTTTTQSTNHKDPWKHFWNTWIFHCISH